MAQIVDPSHPIANFSHPLALRRNALQWALLRLALPVRAIFQASCAIFLQVDTQVLFFLHFVVKIDI